MCPMLQDTESDQLESVGAIGGYQYRKQLYQIWKTTISTRTESKALCSSTIWVHTEYASETSKLSTTDSTISNTTIPITVTEIATSRKLSISRRPNEEASC
ncbi:hypothetical protein CR513_19286, partial [Mucuna pruriens]